MKKYRTAIILFLVFEAIATAFGVTSCIGR